MPSKLPWTPSLVPLQPAAGQKTAATNHVPKQWPLSQVRITMQEFEWRQKHGGTKSAGAESQHGMTEGTAEWQWTGGKKADWRRTTSAQPQPRRRHGAMLAVAVAVMYLQGGVAIVMVVAACSMRHAARGMRWRRRWWWWRRWWWRAATTSVTQRSSDSSIGDLIYSNISSPRRPN